MLRLNSSLEHESQTRWTLFKRNDKARRLVFTSGGVPEQSPPGGGPADHLRRCELSLASGPPKDGQPLQSGGSMGTDSLRSETADVNGEQAV